MFASITAETQRTPTDAGLLPRLWRVLSATGIVMRLAKEGARGLGAKGLTHADLWAEAERRLAR